MTSSHTITRQQWKRKFALACLAAVPLACAAFEVHENESQIQVRTRHYTIDITKTAFRYGFLRPDGTAIAEANAEYGLEFGGGRSVGTSLESRRSKGEQSPISIIVTNDKGATASVEIEPGEHYARFSVKQAETNRILARIGGITPAFGLADHAAFSRHTTELTGYSDGHFRAQEPPGHKRLISNFVISPRRGIAMVNMEKGMKLVRVRTNDAAQGSAAVREMPALYYFLGSPEQIYGAYLKARNREGYTVHKPKYEFFGVGWEAFGALGWNTNEKTVTENVERYLSLGYPLEWMVVGSGFWPNEDPSMRATTSFGMWDKQRYPDPSGFIKGFKERGLKFFIGLRISFIEDGPYSAEGVRKGFFLTENGTAKAYQLGFPKKPAYLLDGENPEAVKWYLDLCQKWLDAGVDGFKEDLFGYKVVEMREGNIDAVNHALMKRGVFVMGRNGYLASAMDTHRIEDFNYDQNQDRGPINSLAFAYSGFPYVYPDIVGGTFGEGRRMGPLNDRRMQLYMMRVAQFGSVHPSMAMGMGPWNFSSKQVEEVMLSAAKLHARLHPYIYSAAIDTHESGFPWTLAPLPLVFPNDPQVYDRENSTVRGYQWMLGPSLLATPLYGNDYATSETRDIYLPQGAWVDYDTGEIHQGPRLLPGFALPAGKTPLFVGGKGVLVLRDLEAGQTSKKLRAVIHRVARRGESYRFTHRDGHTRSEILLEHNGWDAPLLAVTDSASGERIKHTIAPRTGAVEFPLDPGRNYRLSGGAPGE